MAAKATVYVTQDGDMLDLICWRHYGTAYRNVEAGRSCCIPLSPLALLLRVRGEG